MVSYIEDSRVTLRCGEYEVRGLVASDVQLARGDVATATMRPEKLSMVAEADEDGTRSVNQWSARVVSAVYYGDHREYQVEIDDQPMTLTTPANVNVARGAHVIVTCDPSEVVVIADSLG